MEKKNTKKEKLYSQTKKRTPRKITETYLHNAGLYYLERFSASKSHFIFIMMRKVKKSCQHHKSQDYSICKKLVYALAEKFEKCGLLNDTLYAQNLALSFRRKGLARNAIIYKMINKGLDHETSQNALDLIDSDICDIKENAEMHAALALAKRRKIGPYALSPQTPKSQQKALGIFARAGFSYNIANSILKITDGNNP